MFTSFKECLVMANLWIIEDMQELHAVYETIFENSQHQLKFFVNYAQFKTSYDELVEKSTSSNSPDLLIIDIKLEDGDFFKHLNEDNVNLNANFIVVSESSDYQSVYDALSTGALDFIVKPINLSEMQAKVDHHLEKIEEKKRLKDNILKQMNLNITDFTNKEVKIIESFQAKEDKTLHRSQIVQIIWKNIAIHPNTLDVHIYNLRRKLKPYNFNIKAIGSGQFKFIEMEKSLA